MTVRSQRVVFWAGCVYVSIKKQNLEMSYNIVNTFLKGFVCLSCLRSNVFCVKVVLWKGSKSYLMSLLIYECISVIVVLHQA